MNESRPVAELMENSSKETPWENPPEETPYVSGLPDSPTAASVAMSSDRPSSTVNFVGVVNVGASTTLVTVTLMVRREERLPSATFTSTS